MSTSDLVKAYSEVSAYKWGYTQDRPDFDLAVNVIRSSSPTGCILDVGCFRGDFLALFSKNYQKYGIEPSSSAREIAQQRGINLIGSSIERFNIKFPKFNFITLLDVIEHLPYPLKSIHRLAKFLLPGGMLILSTGNTNSVPWRFMRQDYWYYLTEHVSFFNPRWFHWAARQIDFEVLMVIKFSHSKGTVVERWHQFAQCLAFCTLKKAKQHPRLLKIISSVYPFSRASQWQSPPMTLLWKDHMMVVLKSMV